VYGRETWQVINVAYLQKFLDGKVELRIGRIAAGDVFVVSPYDYVFMQNAIDGNPVGIFFNASGMSAYPNATWGAELKVQTTERTYVHGGVYNGDIEHTHELDDHGLDWSMRGPVFLIGEAVYQVNQLKGDPQYPGNYKFGTGDSVVTCGAPNGWPRASTLLSVSSRRRRSWSGTTPFGSKTGRSFSSRTCSTSSGLVAPGTSPTPSWSAPRSASISNFG
jgi:carbohydrate-selective porin OprB